jgi:hypothetical protein
MFGMNMNPVPINWHILLRGKQQSHFSEAAQRITYGPRH